LNIVFAEHFMIVYTADSNESHKKKPLLVLCTIFLL